jgi:ATP-dependent RNA helicase SUPV3L1/SUV3
MHPPRANGAQTITAQLGPTNTGKTHRAVERMLQHQTGMIGLPLRLLAREVYDRVSARVGEAAVALVTGEEKRVPSRPRYWVCTVEAMPAEREVDFVAVDEIQLCGHTERGHLFTDRLLHWRGRQETWFLGADTIRPILERLVPTAVVDRRPRLSRLLGAGALPLRGLPPRTAVVAFSAGAVYDLAERLRVRRGGAAVVLGALSPRARNAQVALYQAGEVDYLVATDAIGMGLNMDVDCVVFAELCKFDGRQMRELEDAELAQIAGRAGRHHNDGRFATLAPLPPLPAAVTRAIEDHRFPVQKRILWRSRDLDTSSLDALAASLRQRPFAACLELQDQAEDSRALVRLRQDSEVLAHARDPESVGLLWEVCQIPDYRQLQLDDHFQLLRAVFLQLRGPRQRLADDWIRQHVDRLDDAAG